MVDLIICLFAIYGISTFVKDMDGPCNIMNKIRIMLFANKYIGVFVANLLSCYFCVGAYSGALVYLLYNHFRHLNGYDFVLWIFGGSAISMFGSLLVEKLSERNND